jgi:hypothetical protein
VAESWEAERSSTGTLGDGTVPRGEAAVDGGNERMGGGGGERGV